MLFGTVKIDAPDQLLLNGKIVELVTKFKLLLLLLLLLSTKMIKVAWHKIKRLQGHLTSLTT